MNASSGSGLWPTRIVCIDSALTSHCHPRPHPRRRAGGVRPQRLSQGHRGRHRAHVGHLEGRRLSSLPEQGGGVPGARRRDRKSTRLNSSHSQISYAVFCLKKKKKRKTENECS